MEKRIDSLIKEKEEYFKQLIKSQEVETQIREKTKLLVLSSSEETDKQIMKVISKFKFPANNISNKIIQPNGGLDHKDYKGIQIIIINDIDSSFDRPLLNRLLADSPGDSLFLGYATGKENLPRDEKMNFANSKFTFYQNLINLAKYKEVVS